MVFVLWVIGDQTKSPKAKFPNLEATKKKKPTLSLSDTDTAARGIPRSVPEVPHGLPGPGLLDGPRAVP